MSGLLRRAALGVESLAARLVRQSRMQPGGAGDVVRLLARLGHAAASHLLDLAGVDAGPVHQGALRTAQDLGRVQSGEHPAALADRGPDRFHDHRVAHRPLLCARRCSS